MFYVNNCLELNLDVCAPRKCKILSNKVIKIKNKIGQLEVYTV